MCAALAGGTGGIDADCRCAARVDHRCVLLFQIIDWWQILHGGTACCVVLHAVLLPAAFEGCAAIPGAASVPALPLMPRHAMQLQQIVLGMETPPLKVMQGTGTAGAAPGLVSFRLACCGALLACVLLRLRQHCYIQRCCIQQLLHICGVLVVVKRCGSPVAPCRAVANQLRRLP